MLLLDKLIITEDRNFDSESILHLYRLNRWSSAEKPDQLLSALRGSHSLVLAYYEQLLVGLGNAISDGYLVVYYPHLLVHPNYHGFGIGTKIIRRLQKKYADYHQQVLVADGKAIQFYEKCGFERAGLTQPMWIYQGKEH